MADTQLLDAPATDVLNAVTPGTATAADAQAAANVTPGDTAVGPNQPLAADTATDLFGHVAPPTNGIRLPEPRKVKTQTIKHDTAPLLDAIAKGTDGTEMNPFNNATRRSVARDSASNLLTAAADAGLRGDNQYAYMLATAERESHLGNMMDEGGGDKYFNGRYGPQTPKGQELGNTQKGDGARFHGRGLVQITGRTNYADWTQRLNNQGVQINGEDADLISHPEQAKDPKIAAQIAAEGMRDGSFTKKHKLGMYVNDTMTDYVGARRVINGQDHANDIAERARAFEAILKQPANSNIFHQEMMNSQMRNLPTAKEGELTAPSQVVDPSLLSGNLMSDDFQKFQPLSEFAKRPIGRFEKDPEPVNVPIPRPRPKDL